MRFSPFHHAPRHSPSRIRAAQCIRALRSAVWGDGWKSRHDKAEAEAERRAYRQSLWNQKRAVGCVETGQLFRSAWEAADKIGIGKNRATQVVRSCKDGRPIIGLRFVLLNGPRWRERTAWNYPAAVGCIETGNLFARGIEAARWCGASQSSIWWSAVRGTAVHGRFTFIFLRQEMRAKYARKAATIWRKKETHENRNRTNNAGRQERAA